MRGCPDAEDSCVCGPRRPAAWVPGRTHAEQPRLGRGRHRRGAAGAGCEGDCVEPGPRVAGRKPCSRAAATLPPDVGAAGARGSESAPTAR
ncbi:uncharacterized protein LOC143684063 isoform X2 [Tamandua tetradactyla]|uniref:uncharacterized protein LOC143684063 isoform X2 n=1 Tax=Tamandua tetradactyla TaxID=48850 RepID=UPI00405442DB